MAGSTYMLKPKFRPEKNCLKMFFRENNQELSHIVRRTASFEIDQLRILRKLSHIVLNYYNF